MLISEFRRGEGKELRSVFYSSVHALTFNDYSTEQQQAWTPLDYDVSAWVERIRANQPFVAEINGEIVGFADLQRDGYIDLFYVKGGFAGQGIGTQLMERIHQAAYQRGSQNCFPT